VCKIVHWVLKDVVRRGNEEREEEERELKGRKPHSHTQPSSIDEDMMREERWGGVILVVVVVT